MTKFVRFGLGLLLLGGCAGGTRDVTGDGHFVGDYRPGQRLLVVSPVFIEGGPGWSKRNVRTAFPESASPCGGGEHFYLIPTSIAEYEANPKRYHYQTNPGGFNVLGVLPPGTVIEIASADYMYWPEQRLFLTATIKSGAFDGIALDIIPLSKRVDRNRFTIKRECLRPLSE